MLKFFRAIRKKLIEQDNVRKYLIYAIGEILLVVIGILIALQVNNWNEERANKKLEKEYYCRFLENINQDETVLMEFISNTNDRLVAANEYVRLLQQEKVTKLKIGEALYDLVTGSPIQFETNNTAYLDLTAGSNLNIIEDLMIKEALNNYYKKIDGYTEIAKLNNDFLAELLRSNDNIYENGWLHARAKNERFLEGMDEDVYEQMNISFDEILNPLLMDSLRANGYRYISTIYRRTQLNGLIQEEINNMQTILSTKCEEIE